MLSTVRCDQEKTVSAIPEKKLLTPEEYIILEREAEFKSEYRNGQIVMMPGASRDHNLITVNVSSGLHIQLLDKTCEVYTNDMRVKVSNSGLYTYPDVIVVCDEPRFEDGHFDTLLNPTVIVAVLSPSTEDYDRRGKFYSYQTLESLQEYILVSQYDVCVEQYIQQEEDWKLIEYRSLDDVMINASIECQLALRAIYAKVKIIGR